MSSPAAKLKGITWNHTRGYLPMVATAQRFSELHPQVEISWEKRSLQEFADFPVNRLAEEFDLLVIDHPFVGFAAAHGTLLPLDEYLPQSFLADQARHSVGKSHQSYSYDGHQWALAIDAAAPVSSCRPDLLGQLGIAPPETWQELVELARHGFVALPAIPIDSLTNFYMVCLALGADLFPDGDQVVSHDIGAQALSLLRELLSFCPPECFFRDPIAIYEAMASGDSIAYCPFAYGYSNYSRPGYARCLLQFGDLVGLGEKGRLCSTLGGAGLAISARCQHKEEAAEYARFVAGGECQRTLYFASGGQPAHRLAWEDAEVNAASNSFFERTLPALDRAYLRPRWNGYLDFQDKAGPAVQHCLQDGGNPREVIEQLDRLYRDSQQEATQR
ncbi:MAG: extracellular solute-binding protein [Acidobacteriota bacterium]